MLILSCQRSKEEFKKERLSLNYNCDSSFLDGVYYRGRFFILTLECGIFEYDKSLKKNKIYNLFGKFSISGDSLFLISKNGIYTYKNQDFFQLEKMEGLIGYAGGFYLSEKGIFKNFDTIEILEIEDYKFYNNELIIGTNGYGLYIIRDSKVMHFVLGSLPSNFVKSISIYKDTLVLGFSEPFSKSKIGFFYKDRAIKVFEFSEDYITHIYSDSFLFVGTSSGLFKYENGQFYKILDGYILKILHFENNELFLILNGKIKKLNIF